MNLAEMKSQMRAEVRAARKAIPPSRREDAAEDAWRLYMNAGLPSSGVIAVYSPMGSEISPEYIAVWLDQQRVTLALPVEVHPESPLTFRAVVDLHAPQLPRLSTPLPSAPTVQPHVIIVPLLAFDSKGRRLGQGKGFYDRTIAAERRRAPRPLVIGLAFACQQVPQVPVGEFDERLDGVLTETAYLTFP